MPRVKEILFLIATVDPLISEPEWDRPNLDK